MLKKALLGVGIGAFLTTSALASVLSLQTTGGSYQTTNETAFMETDETQSNQDAATSYQILETATYDDQYIQQLNEDIATTSNEEWVYLDEYEWTEDLYPEPTLGDSYDVYLGRYDYETEYEEEDTYQAYSSTDLWMGEYDDKMSSDPDVYFDVYCDIDNSYKQSIALDWDVGENQDNIIKYATMYCYDYVDINDKIELYVKGYSEVDGWKTHYFVDRTVDDLGVPSDAEDIYLYKIEFKFYYDTKGIYDWDSNNFDFYFDTIYATFYWEYTVSDSGYEYIDAKNIYIGDEYLDNHDFTTAELEELIEFENIDMNDVSFNNLSIDKENRVLTGEYQIDDLDPNQTTSPWVTFSIPIENEEQKWSESIYYESIYIDERTLLDGHDFSEDELEDLIIFKDIDMSDVDFRNLSLDPVNQEISGEYAISNLDDNQINIAYQSFSIPFATFNFDYLFTISPESASQWQHLEDGDIKYWQSPPETIFTYNNDWIKSAYTYGQQDQILARFYDEIETWNFQNDDDKNTVLAKIENYAINYWNYDDVKAQYLDSDTPELVLLYLEPDPVLDDYAHLENVDLNAVFYVLKNAQVNVYTTENNVQETFVFDLNEFVGAEITLTDDQIDANSLNTNWKLAIACEVDANQNSIYTSDLLSFMDLDGKNYELLHDVKISVDELNETIIYHEYFFQAEGFDLGEDISFVLSDGTVLDQNFVVIQESENSDLQLGDNGFVNVRYWATLSSEEEQYITLIDQGGEWYSPQFEQNIQEIDPSFDEEELEYVFNQTMNMIVNPYDTSLGEGITAASEVRYGIETVTDVANDQEVILETWDSGNFSHTSTVDGKALFDAVFGADVNGFFDPVGFLDSGEHEIVIDLAVAESGFNDTFKIIIDLEPVEMEVSSNGNLKQLSIWDQDGEVQELWYSNEPITFVVNDIDIASIEAYILHSNGSWYEMPVPIKSVQEDNQWSQEIDATVDYEGLTKVVITDQAGNVKTIYFLTNTNEDEVPVINFDESVIYESQEYGGDPLYIITESANLVVTNPVVNDISVTRLSLDEHGNLNEENMNDLVEDYEITPEEGYDFGTTLDQDGERLPYAADELTPFLENLEEVTDETWETYNKIISLEEPGFYKVEIFTCIVESPKSVQYFYLNEDQEVILIDTTSFQTEMSYFGTLPDSPQNPDDPANDILSGLDEEQNLLLWLQLVFFSFEIESVEIQYSLMWYSEFSYLNYEGNEELEEGKYLIVITDVFGNEYSYQFLILDKAKNAETRESEGLMQIYNEDQNEDTAFWKGDFIWNIWRYEDEDHADWEFEQFFNDWVADGNDPDDAYWAYTAAKYDPTWDGDYDSGPPSGDDTWDDFLNNNDWMNDVRDGLDDLGQYNNDPYSPSTDYEPIDSSGWNSGSDFDTSDETSDSVLWTTVGLSVVGGTATIGTAFLMIRRFRTKRIR